MNLSEHFDEEDFLCRHCGRGHGLIDPVLVRGLERLRAMIGRPVQLTNAYRCAEHNRQVGGVEQSYHTQGKAADIFVIGLTALELAQLCERIPEFHNGGIGTYPAKKMVHVDTGVRRRWRG